MRVVGRRLLRCGCSSCCCWSCNCSNTPGSGVLDIISSISPSPRLIIVLWFVLSLVSSSLLITIFVSSFPLSFSLLMSMSSLGAAPIAGSSFTTSFPSCSCCCCCCCFWLSLTIICSSGCDGVDVDAEDCKCRANFNDSWSRTLFLRAIIIRRINRSSSSPCPFKNSLHAYRNLSPGAKHSHLRYVGLRLTNSSSKSRGRDPIFGPGILKYNGM